MWPGLVGKGSPGAEPCIDLDTMLDLTAKAEVNGVKFDGVDIFLFDPHISIDIGDDGLKQVADKIRAKGLVVGSVVAPVWPPTGGGSAMGDAEERKKFVGQVEKACRIARKLREMGVRPHGVVRIDSACGVTDWEKDPKGNTKRIAATFKEAAKAAKDNGERLAAEGEICWGGMHSWKYMTQLLEEVGQPKSSASRRTWRTRCFTRWVTTRPNTASCPRIFIGSRTVPRRHEEDDQGAAPWTIDFHVAQNDATVKGSGSHDKTGRHCLATDPNGKLNIARDAGYWMRDDAARSPRNSNTSAGTAACSRTK
jgi:hypothetical protein